MCDDSDVYIVVRGITTVKGINNAKKRSKKKAFKNNALFRLCISKIIKKLTDNAEGLDIVVLMFNLLKYSNNYSMTSGSLWNYYKVEVIDDANENSEAGNYMINNKKATTSKHFEYKLKIIGSTLAGNNTLGTEVVIPLKYLSKFWRPCIYL